MTDLRAQEAEFRARARGNGRAHVERMLPPPSEPMRVARALAREWYTHGDGPKLRHWRGGWWEWRTSHWIEVEQRAALAHAYAFTEHATYQQQTPLGPVARSWAPNKYKTANLLESLAAIVHLPERVNQPCWIEGGHDGTIVACRNGLLEVTSRTVHEHTPRFFNSSSPGSWARRSP